MVLFDVKAKRGSGVKPNTWEFVRDPNGTYSVFRRNELLREGIPERWFEREICAKWGFCQQECAEIQRQIAVNGRAIMTL